MSTQIDRISELAKEDPKRQFFSIAHLCMLRTHQSPGEWQHSLPACMLALAVRDLHPLDSFKGFYRLIFGSSSSKLSQRDNNVGPVKSFF